MNTVTAQTGLIHGAGFEIVDGAYFLSSGSRLNVERAAQLLSDRSIETVICSGRGPVEGEAYGSTEARLMADYLVDAGFNSKQIEIEDTSTSAVGNWSKSAPIIEALDADSVLGITVKVSSARMQMIGDFVAHKSNFELVGYAASEQKAMPKDYIRELIGQSMTRRFLASNAETPMELLDEAYEQFKSKLGLAALKRFIHRASAEPACKN